MINEQEPDLVVFTGDLVNDRAEEIDDYIEVFRQIKSKDGVFSITGNHDYGEYFEWSSEQAKAENFERLIAKHGELGFDILMNESRKVTRGDSHFNVVGLPTSIKPHKCKIFDPLKLWKIMQNDKKMYKNHLNFILPDKIGKCTIRKDIKKSDVLSLLNEELRT